MSLDSTISVGARDRALIGGPMAGDQARAVCDTKDVLERLGIPHALIGGLAVGVRSGVPRATEDSDFAIASSADIDRVVAAMEAAGFRLQGRHPHSVNFRHPSGEPVQLAIDAGFDPFVARAEPVPLGAISVAVVLTEDLIRMKERAARDPRRRKSKALRDLADIELLKGDVGDPDEGW